MEPKSFEKFKEIENQDELCEANMAAQIKKIADELRAEQFAKYLARAVVLSCLKK